MELKGSGTQLNQIYKCNICGNIVEVLHTGAGELVCCGQPMELRKEKTQDEGREKHLPVIKKTEEGIKVEVGSVPHPMEEKHFIEWIEIIADGQVYKTFLRPGAKPEAEFCIKAERIEVREYCNVHGLWKSS
jgi:superoxide reductase